ncbi:MAG TPA: DUF1775 domain-containing protein [Devosiaceae bacterium]
MLIALCSTSMAFAHITLETASAPVGSTYKAVLRVPHGCDGAPTTAIRVRLPAGFVDAKPMPKAGWTLNTVSGAYASPVNNHGAPVTEGVTEIDWTGGNLPDAFYDEFVLRGTLADSLATGTKLYFPVVQECGAAADRWIEIPADGQPEPEKPAPGLTLTPAR